ncbi:MAG: hypothetical protein LBS29_01860 [Endomicrobium sp.]|jgi:hypothetical protein|nr:hypothetical protein [Endomicrobium sp.]
MKKNIIFLSFFLLIILSGVFYILTNLLSKNKAKELEFLATERVKAQITILLPYFNKSLETSDDINLLTNIENLSKSQNISSCFILDSKNKVLIHNNTNQWNVEKNSQIYTIATTHKTYTVQKTSNPEILLISHPLAFNHTLCCIVSIKKTLENANYWQIKYFTIAISSTILILTLFYFLAKLIILLPFNRIKKSLERQYLKNHTDNDYNEITDIFIKQKDKESQKIQRLLQENQSLNKIIEYVQNEHKQNNLALIILNSFKQIVYAYDDTKIFLKENFKINNHIFESSTNITLINMVSFLNQNLNDKVIEHFQNFTVIAQTIKDNHTLFGIIIKITNIL